MKRSIVVQYGRGFRVRASCRRRMLNRQQGQCCFFLVTFGVIYNRTYCFSVCAVIPSRVFWRGTAIAYTFRNVLRASAGFRFMAQRKGRKGRMFLLFQLYQVRVVAYCMSVKKQEREGGSGRTLKGNNNKNYRAVIS